MQTRKDIACNILIVLLVCFIWYIITNKLGGKAPEQTKVETQNVITSSKVVDGIN